MKHSPGLAMKLGAAGAALLLAACGARESAAPTVMAAVTTESVPATAFHLYVSPNGLDSSPGTEADPFKTIGRAAKQAVPGTTVHVAPGVYAGGFQTTANGSPAGRIYFVSTTRWGARIVPPPNSPNDTAWDNRGSFVDIAGFEVDGGAYEGGTKWTKGIYSGGSYDVIRNNHIHHIAQNAACSSAGGAGIGIDSYYKGVHSDAIGNNVHDIGPVGCHFIQGIYINTSGRVQDNIIYRVGEAGIHLWHDANNVIISNNTVSTSNTGIIVGGGDFYHTKGPNDHTQVFNNIVYDNKNGISEQGSTGKNNSYRNNLVFQNTAANWDLRNGLAASGTIAASPRFAGYTRTGTPDFRLAANSPAIGKGVPDNAHPTDFSGRARSPETGYDLGALQH